jgi:hypothetical protein
MKNFQIFKCNYECSHTVEPCGPTSYDCAVCSHYTLKIDNDKVNCVSYCPIGYHVDEYNKKCIKCHGLCTRCFGSLETQCSACKLGFIYKPDTNQCLNQCPIGYFSSKLIKFLEHFAHHLKSKNLK